MLMTRRWVLLLAVLVAVGSTATELLPVRSADAQLFYGPRGAQLQNAAGANGNGSTLDTSLSAVVTLQISGTFSATVNPEGSNDNTNWNALTCYTLDSTTSVSTMTTTGIWRCNVVGIPIVRARVSGWSSGSVTVVGNATSLGFAGSTIDQPTTSASQLFTDLSIFYQAATNCVDQTASTAAVIYRAAANDFGLSRTAAGAETHNIGCFLTAPFRTSTNKGYKLTAFSIVQQITTAVLTSNTFNTLATTAYVNNVADAVAAYGGTVTITMPTATQTNPYVTAATLGTAAFMTTAATGVSLDWTVVMQNTGVYRVYGVVGTWTLQN